MTRAPNAVEGCALGGGGAALCAVAWWAYVANHHERFPHHAWHLSDSIAHGIGVASAAIAIAAGLWLWVRLPTNPTGPRMMAQGSSNRAIAAALFCSDKTVESHIRSIFTKLDLAEHPDENRRVAAVIRWLTSSP